MSGVDPPDFNSPSQIRSFLTARGFNPQKRFGQNFLIQPNARAEIINELELTGGESVWEIGPGIGQMTFELLKRAGEVTVFEIDRGFIAILRELFSEHPRLRIVEGDVLKTWPSEAERFGSNEGEEAASARPFLVGNLPYNAASAILRSLVEHNYLPRRTVITVQKELADRIVAEPGSTAYSSFSLLCRLAWDVRAGMVLKPGNFYPRPEVDSRVVVLKPRGDQPEEAVRVEALHLLRCLFASRRKTIRNNLQSCLPGGRQAAETCCRSAGIDPGGRPGEISVDLLISLASQVLDYRRRDS